MLKLSLGTPHPYSIKLFRNISLYSLGLFLFLYINYKFNILGIYSDDLSDQYKIILTMKLLKVSSLGLIFLESIEGLRHSESEDDHPNLWRLAKLSSILCFITAALLTITLFETRGIFYNKLAGCFGEVDINHFKIIVDLFLSMIPLIGFMVVNVSFMCCLNKSDPAYKVARNYLYTVNMPSVVSLLMILSIVMMFLANINYIYVSIFNSGAIALLIFMTLCLSFYAETLLEN